MQSRFVAPLPMILIAFFLWLPLADEPGLAQEYVGSDTCAECHEDQMADYRKSVHYQTETGEWDVTGCESCHGPGAQHSEEGDIQYIFSFAGEEHTVADKVDKCLSCHGGRENTNHYLMGTHMKGTIDCATCHKPHADSGNENLIADSSYELCTSCHEEVTTAIHLNERHRILEGIVQCTDCHDNHSTSPRDRLGGFKQEKCFTCHTDKQGPFVFEHLSSRVEGCNACHANPHGSVNRHMLAYQKVSDLCYSCHAVVPGFHTRFISGSNCTNCHSMIHGSNLHEAFLK